MKEHEAGLAVAEEMLDPGVVNALRASVGSSAFGAERGALALEFVFAKLWTRGGLDRRARSLVTLGILIALGHTEELRVHLLAALRNGCTLKELEEVLYHSTAYAGFPAANKAAAVATQVLAAEGLISE